LEELVEFARLHKIEKPRTWIQEKGRAIEKNFISQSLALPSQPGPSSNLQMPPELTLQPKPKSQSKVALKKQRMLSQGTKSGLGLTGFKKLNLQLGKEAVDQEE